MFRTEYYLVNSKKIKTPVKFVMLADLHNNSFGENNETLFEEIKRIHPDFVCIAGDMLIGNSQKPFQIAQDLVKRLAKEYPVYYGLGNHESRMQKDIKIYGDLYEQYMNPLKALGVQVLVNEKREFSVGESRFEISGYDLPMKYFEKFNRYEFRTEQISQVLGTVNGEDSKYRILLAHNPVYFKQYSDWGADLTLSGHLHGGIIRLPFLGGVITPQAKLFPRYCAGCYTIGNKKMVVSRGLGTHTVPFRIGNPEELSVICLQPEKK